MATNFRVSARSYFLLSLRRGSTRKSEGRLVFDRLNKKPTDFWEKPAEKKEPFVPAAPADEITQQEEESQQ